MQLLPTMVPSVLSTKRPRVGHMGRRRVHLVLSNSLLMPSS